MVFCRFSFTNWVFYCSCPRLNHECPSRCNGLGQTKGFFCNYIFGDAFRAMGLARQKRYNLLDYDSDNFMANSLSIWSFACIIVHQVHEMAVVSAVQESQKHNDASLLKLIACWKFVKSLKKKEGEDFNVVYSVNYKSVQGLVGRRKKGPWRLSPWSILMG